MTMGAAAGFGAVTSVLNILSTTNAAKAKTQRIGEVSRLNIGYAKNDYMRRSEIAFKQEESINRELGKVLSDIGLEAMVARASLTAAAGSTGLSGTTIEEVVDEVDYHQIFDNQVVVSRAERDTVDVYRSRLADFMNFEAEMFNAAQMTKENLLNQQDPLMAGLSAAVSTASTAYSLRVKSDWSKEGL